MSYEVSDIALPAALEQARAAASQANLAHAGGVTPPVAWQLSQAGQAVLVDVRTAEERKFVGHVPGTVHVPWATGTSLTRNPRFVRELEAKVAKEGGKDAVVLLLCRSGKRSALAAEAAEKAGFTHVFNVLEGFEGELDAEEHRGGQDGWRFHGLPWVQD
ncbi:rhodanese-like domain-containing protein [Pigmentiphaga aceris]|uniref:Rhodanese-like domain-containing protein n=1 Tax=Pigmentiphaga aceris TaxID=1940612 RepID=A0A5C0B0Q8_9BURK|nr:rhodanese-like domain-containing protein [Pigmentiphaga aceris]QEI06431.1 rhodanese-like domain-containing protein [Pigmentiphaga aceris]